MNKLLDKKGIFWIPTMQQMILIFLALAIPSAALTKDSFRERKAIEMCQTEVNMTEESCISAVAGMSKEEILAYIKDDEPGTPTNFALAD
jgi:hypothetical protein